MPLPSLPLRATTNQTGPGTMLPPAAPTPAPKIAASAPAPSLNPFAIPKAQAMENPPGAPVTPEPSPPMDTPPPSQTSQTYTPTQVRFTPEDIQGWINHGSSPEQIYHAAYNMDPTFKRNVDYFKSQFQPQDPNFWETDFPKFALSKEYLKGEDLPSIDPMTAGIRQMAEESAPKVPSASLPGGFSEADIQQGGFLGAIGKPLYNMGLGGAQMVGALGSIPITNEQGQTDLNIPGNLASFGKNVVKAGANTVVGLGQALYSAITGKGAPVYHPDGTVSYAGATPNDNPTPEEQQLMHVASSLHESYGTLPNMLRTLVENPWKVAMDIYGAQKVGQGLKKGFDAAQSGIQSVKDVSMLSAAQANPAIIDGAKALGTTPQELAAIVHDAGNNVESIDTALKQHFGDVYQKATDAAAASDNLGQMDFRDPLRKAIFGEQTPPISAGNPAQVPLPSLLQDAVTKQTITPEGAQISQSLAEKMGGQVTSFNEAGHPIITMPDGTTFRAGFMDYGTGKEPMSLVDIEASTKGTGVGTKAMEALKEISDETGKPLHVSYVNNPDFFRKFSWLDEERNGNSFTYSPENAPAAPGFLGRQTEKIARKLIDEYIKPNSKDLSFGKDPAGVILRRGIVGNSPEGFRDAIGEEMNAVGQQIEPQVIQEATAHPVTQDFKAMILDPIDEALKKAAGKGTSSMVNKELYNALLDLKERYTTDYAPNAEGSLEAAGTKDFTGNQIDNLALKRAIADDMNWTGNEMLDKPLMKVKWKIFSNLQDNLEQNVPGIDALNTDYSDLVSAKTAITRRLPVIQRNSPIGLLTGMRAIGTGMATTVATGNPVVGAGAGLLEGGAETLLKSTAARTRAAQMLYNAPATIANAAKSADNALGVAGQLPRFTQPQSQQ